MEKDLGKAVNNPDVESDLAENLFTKKVRKRRLQSLGRPASAWA